MWNKMSVLLAGSMCDNQIRRTTLSELARYTRCGKEKLEEIETEVDLREREGRD
ncbi:hypothetical protein F2Q68_00044404 [Brassica cretica]|uniref:Uncharacterized protein n=2 Tax=Brassica cretica TaxID=69181 RepID=A0A8S9LN32_BRACR|nr:hypothetical protein F2Q68_00044404 [Brassica cretica]KAF3517323.1 hypothetical protein DY000_02060500 [Brassica cretica]